MKRSIVRRAAALLAAAACTLSAGVLPQGAFTAEAAGSVIYCSPNGSGDGSSTSSPTTVAKAITSVSAGGYIYLLEGTYKFSSPIKIENTNSGSSGKYKTIAAYNGANVVFDFSGESTSNSNYGIILDGSYWHFYGFEVTRAGDNGMLLAGSNNIVEMMTFSENQDTGLQISRYRSACATIDTWPSNNLVKNCTSKNNCDDATMENADGFAAKLTCGTGNVFDGCLSYNNSDDGWDLYAKPETGAIGVVTIQNCTAFRNGFTEDGRGYGNCDGNGFKLGGGGVGTRHVVTNCFAFENLNCGFTDNNNPEFGVMTNCTAYNNGIGGNKKANYFVYRCNSTAALTGLVTYYNTSKVSKTKASGIVMTADKFKGTVKNTLYYNGGYYYGSFTADGSAAKSGNSVSPGDSEFTNLIVAAMGTDFHAKCRNADGSPNFGGFAETSGTYKSIGYHFSAGVTQKSTPSIPNTASGTGTVTPTPTLTPATFTDGSAYMLRNVNSGLYLEVKDGNAANNENIQQWGATGAGANGEGAWNVWRLYAAGDGYYYVYSALGDGRTYVLDVAGKKADDGTNIDLYQYNGGTNQQIKLVQNSDGSYKLYTRVSGDASVIEVANGSFDYGANVQEWTMNGFNCQDWQLIPATLPLSGVLVRDLSVKDTEHAAGWQIAYNAAAGSKVFGDRDFTAVTLPAALAGAEQILTACDSKAYTSDLATFTAAVDEVVYVGVDTRLTAIPAWLSGYTNTGLTVTLSDANSVTMALYSKSVSAGTTVTLGSNGQSSGVMGYTVFVTEQPEEPTQAPTEAPTQAPTEAPTQAPTEAPTQVPTEAPTQAPTEVPTQPTAGDVNADGTVSVLDVVLLQKYLVEQNTFTLAQWQQADVNGDGKVNVIDLALLKRMLLH